MIANIDQLIEQTKTRVQGLVGLDNQWNLESNKDGYTIHTKLNPENGLNINRTETNATVDLEQFVQLVIDQSRRKEFDSNFQEGKLIEKPDAHTSIYHSKSKPPSMLVSARDFCILNRVIRQGDGSVIIISKSIEHPQVPPVKGTQRGEIVFQAWFISKLQNGQTNIIVISHVNPHGDIPKAIINQGAKQQAELIKKAIEVVKNKK